MATVTVDGVTYDTPQTTMDSVNQSVTGERRLADERQELSDILTNPQAAKALGPDVPATLAADPAKRQLTQEAINLGTYGIANPQFPNSGVVSSDAAAAKDGDLNEAINKMPANLRDRGGAVKEGDIWRYPDGSFSYEDPAIGNVMRYDAQGNPVQQGANLPQAQQESSDPLMQLYKRMMDENAARLKREEDELAANAARATDAAKQTAAKNFGASQLALIRGGGFSAMSGQAYLTSLNREAQMKLHQIEMDYRSALQKARDARTDVDFKLADAMLQRADKLKEQFMNEQNAYVDRLLKYQQIEKMKGDNLQQKLENMAKSGMQSKDIDPELLAAWDETYGFIPGTTAGILDFVYDEAQLDKAGKVADIDKKYMDSAIALQNLLNEVPKGTSIYVNGREYFGRATEKKNIETSIEVDENGNGTLIWFNKDITPGDKGFMGTVSLGHIGSARDGWINAYDPENGFSYRYNTNTGEAKPVITSGGQTNPELDPQFMAWAYDHGEISQHYGQPSKVQPKGHTGVDIANVEGTPIKAFFPDGVNSLTVVKVVDDQKNGSKGYGNYVELADDKGNVWRYAHLRETYGTDLQEGMVFTDKNTVIGYMGRTGSVYSVTGGDGSHLHIEKIAQSKPLTTATPTAKQRDAALDKAKLLTTADVQGAVNPIDDQAVIKATAMASDIFGKRAGTQPEYINPILSAYAKGKTFDQIQDDLRYSSQSGDLGPKGKFWLYRKGMENAMGPKATAGALQTQMDQIDDYLTSGDLVGAQDKLLATARNATSATQQNAVEGMTAGLQALSDIEFKLNEFIANGGDVGLLVGTEEQIRNKLGQTKNPEIARLGTEILGTIQSYRLRVTGKAFTQQENEEYQKLFPNIGKSYELSSANLDGLRSVFRRDLRNFYIARLGQSIYDGLALDERVMGNQNVITPSVNESDAEWERIKSQYGITE